MKVLLRVLQIVLLLVLALGAFLLRCHDVRETFFEGRIYFYDADCYSRMTRVRLIDEAPWSIVRHHNFENFPQGIRSHATAPLDYLILAGKWILEVGFTKRSWGKGSVLAAQSADLSGALVSPLLGTMTAIFLAIWGWRITATFSQGMEPVPAASQEDEPLSRRRRSFLHAVAAVAPALLFAVSPILVQATQLGRPDHQSLLVFLLAVALGAEAMLPREATKQWALTAGLAWGLALWVSLYEPLILLVIVATVLGVFHRRAFLARERRWEGAALAGVVLLSFFVEGGRVAPVAPEVTQYFRAWSRTIGELGPVSLTNPVVASWMGWLLYASPILLWLAQRFDRRAWPALALVLVTLGLTCWQLRWAYFATLVFAMTLPWQLMVLRRCWIAVPALVVSLFASASHWEATFFPEDRARETLNAKIHERRLLREMARQVRGPFIAPWWESPPLAYWSRQPGVAGSSHESLAGIADVSRFYLATDSASAAEILRRRKVEFVMTDETSRLTSQAVTLLGGESTNISLAHRLNENPSGAELYLKPTNTNLFYKLFIVDRAKLNP